MTDKLTANDLELTRYKQDKLKTQLAEYHRNKAMAKTYEAKARENQAAILEILGTNFKGSVDDYDITTWEQEYRRFSLSKFTKRYAEVYESIKPQIEECTSVSTSARLRVDK